MRLSSPFCQRADWTRLPLWRAVLGESCAVVVVSAWSTSDKLPLLGSDGRKTSETETRMEMGLNWQKYTEELLVAVSHIQDSNNGEEIAKPETCVTAKNNDGYLVFNISDFFFFSFLNGTRKSPFLCRTRKSLTTARNTVHCLSSEILKQWGRIKPVTTENTKNNKNH